MTITVVVLKDIVDQAFMNYILELDTNADSVLIICQKNLLNKDSDNKYRIFTKEFENNYADLRNFALSKVKTEWVLFLDSDEKLSIDLQKKIPELMSDKQIDGYWLSRRTYISPEKYLKHGLFYPDYQLRLFRVKPEYHYIGAIHEEISVPENKTKHIYYDILHYPTHPKYTKFSDFKNLLPYIRIETQEIKKQKKNKVSLIIAGITKGITLFLGGFFRGKGFLDGWAGLRAHILFSISISLPYINAALT